MGEGSVFTVLMPLEVEERLDTHEVVVGEEHPGAHTILVVEDDLEFREQMRATLSDAGFEVVCISRGEDVVTVADDVHPSIITLDVMLPGIDGWEVLRRLKASNAQQSTPVVMVTASDNHELGVALGADDFFVKPFDHELLVARIRELTPTGDDVAVLLIDDDPNVHTIVRESLSGNGYRVVSAEDGVTGLELAESMVPGVIILDLMMPGMNGFEVATRLRDSETTADIPLIILTARDLTAAERDELNGKISSLLTKGASSPSILLETVRRLDRRTPG